MIWIALILFLGFLAISAACINRRRMPSPPSLPSRDRFIISLARNGALTNGRPFHAHRQPLNRTRS